MTNPYLREALLKQNGGASIEAELNVLNGLIEAERRRARRLTLWTVAVWAVWFALLAVIVGGYSLARASGPRVPPPTSQPSTQPAAAPSAARPSDTMPAAVFKGFVALLFLISLLCLPAIGIILLIMMILARRSASLSQIRGSLASIDAQLRLLAMNPKTPGPQP